MRIRMVPVVCSVGLLPWSIAAAGPPIDAGVAAIETGIPELDFSAGVPWGDLGAGGGLARLDARMRAYAVPAVSLAIIEKGRVAWARAYGVLSASDTVAANVGTLFEAASTTKFLTAVVTLELAARGDLDLDGDVNRILRTWTVPESPWTAKETVTPRRLLRHTSGFNRPDGGFSIREGGVPTLAQVLSGTPPAGNLPAAIEFEPGSLHRYSNFGYVVLQQVLEDARGMPYSRIVDGMIFEPLGLGASVFEPGELPPPERRPCHHDPEGTPLESSPHPSAFAQGGLWTTPSDLARITVEVLGALREERDRVVRPEAARLLVDDPLAIDPAENMGFALEGTGTFLLPCQGGFALCHPGFNAPGSTCLLIAFPATGQGAVIMTNGANGLQLSLEILSAAAAVYDWPRIEFAAPR